MNINFFTPRFVSNHNYLKNNTAGSCPINNKTYPKLAPLKADTVSFGNAKVSAHIVEQFRREQKELLSIGNVYHALNVAGSGVSNLFRVADNVEHLVKTPESRVGKMIRAGLVKIKDIIRDTNYPNDDIYNLENFMKYLDDMASLNMHLNTDKIPVKKLMKRGYIPSEEQSLILTSLAKPDNNEVSKYVLEKMAEKGYDEKEVKAFINKLVELDHTPSNDEFFELFGELNKEIPDLDIRLDPKKIPQEQIKKLPEKYRYCISKPQSSGYEDIQIRLVGDFVKKKYKSVPYEVITLFGENYHDAKYRESTFVYSNLRKFKELGVSKYLGSDKFAKESKKANQNIDFICDIFRNKISKTEFLYGKNKDLTGITQNPDIHFTDDEIDMIDRVFEDLSKEIVKPYAKVIKKTAMSRRKLVRSALISDRKTLKEIKGNLKETIELYNTGKAYEYTNNNPYIKPIKK